MKMRCSQFRRSARRATHRYLIRGMPRLSERAYAQPEEAFREALRAEEHFRVTRAISSAEVMLAHTLLVRGQPGPAMKVFQPFLEKAETENLAGCLMMENPTVIPLLRQAHDRKVRRAYIEHVLEMIGVPLNAVEASGGKALSERELKVLRVMAEGLGNREIAARLFVSEATVKLTSSGLCASSMQLRARKLLAGEES